MADDAVEEVYGPGWLYLNGQSIPVRERAVFDRYRYMWVVDGTQHYRPSPLSGWTIRGLAPIWEVLRTGRFMGPDSACAEDFHRETYTPAVPAGQLAPIGTRATCQDCGRISVRTGTEALPPLPIADEDDDPEEGVN